MGNEELWEKLKTDAKMHMTNQSKTGIHRNERGLTKNDDEIIGKVV